jgi:hypothetical protein
MTPVEPGDLSLCGRFTEEFGAPDLEAARNLRNDF